MRDNKSFAAQVSDNAELLYLVRGFDEGEAAWHYIMLENKQKKHLFLRDIKGPPVSIRKYGKIIKSGWGEQPPETIAEEIKAKYS